MIKRRIEELTDILNKANTEYFINNDPILSDTEYDKLHKELIELEEAHPELKLINSPTDRIGGYIYDSFKTKKHEKKLLSLQDVFNDKEILKFDKTTPLDTEYICEYKHDGLAVSLRYKKGILVEALTRGDGSQGDDVTESVKTIKTVPLQLTEAIDITVRGEIYMSYAVFQALNAERAIKGDKLLANSRNAAVGALKTLDTRETAKKELNIYVFEILSNNKLKKHEETLKYLTKLGFRVGRYIKFKKIEDFISSIPELTESRKQLDYNIDGLVLKVNSLGLRDKLGVRTKTPKWAIAFKFPAEQKETIIKEIHIQVGRTGALTPRAEFEPIVVDGSTVTFSTLHNQDYIDMKDIRIGDHVIIEKAGDIIPSVVKVLTDKRTGKETIFKLPDVCPVCGSKINKEEVTYKCTNEWCPAKIERSLSHYVSEKGVNIDSLGKSTIKVFLEEGIIKTIPDLYKLTEKKEEILALDGFGIKSYNKLITNINKSKQEKVLSNFISGLGIDLFGERASKKLCSKYKTIEDIFKLTTEDLLQIDSFGEKTAKSIIEFMKINKELILETKALGVNMQEPTVELSTKKLEGLNIVVTGSLVDFTRKTIKAYIQDNGGNVRSSVSKATDLLVCGENAGSKLDKAKENDIKIITEKELLALVGDER